METANIQELISGKGFIMVNKGLAKAVGLVPATIYGELVSTFLYWKDREQLTIQDGKEWFFCTIEDLEDKTTVKKDAQSKAIKTLEKEGLIITKRFGLPAKRYFHVTDKYIQILIGNYFSGKPQSDDTGVSGGETNENPHGYQYSGKPQTGLRENRKQDFGKTDTNNKALNNKEFNNYDDDDKRTSSPASKNNIQDLKEDSSESENPESIIEELREVTKNDLPTVSFNAVVRKVMDLYQQGKVSNLRSYLMTSLAKRMQELQERREQQAQQQQAQSYARNKQTKEEVKPDWFDRRNEEGKKDPTPETLSADVEERRQRLQERFGY